jgi:oleate hydratase
MKAHIVGGGFGGLAAAALLIRNAGLAGTDITIYEADEKPGGGFFLEGSPLQGYSIPGSIFDREFRCAFDLLAAIPTLTDPGVSVSEQFFTFNRDHAFDDKTHVIDRELRVVHGPRYGLSWVDALRLARLSFTPESRLEGQRIAAFFSPAFFDTEFWLLWSTLMGSLPQHSIVEFRRYLNRFLYLFPDLSSMAHVLRSPFNQHESFVKPLAAWLEARGVGILTGTFVTNLVFDSSTGGMTVKQLDHERGGWATSVSLASSDIVLLTTGSQAADRSTGSMTEAPRPASSGRSWALWKRIAEAHPGWGNPDAFFGQSRAADSRWVTFTVTTTGRDFIDQMTRLTGSEPGRGGLLTLKDSGWILSLSIFHQPEVLDQPAGTFVWWGYGLYPERLGNFVPKRMDACSGEEILKEVLLHLRFENPDAIMSSSICVPCNLPYVNNIWLARTRSDRPPVVPPGATNLGLIGQYVEVPHDIAFTFEYSVRTAWEAIYRLLGRGPAPPPVYRGNLDPKGLWAALKVILNRQAP